MTTPPEASCDSPTAACGGDVVGTWMVTSSCLNITGELDLSSIGAGCAVGTITESTLEVTGSMTFGADGSVMDNTTTTGTMAVDLPYECREISGTVVTCDRLAPVISSTFGYASAECADDPASTDAETAACKCTATTDQGGAPGFVSKDASDSATYTATDTTLSLTYFDPVDYSYCVAEDILTMTPPTMNVTGTLAGEIVLQKM